MNHTPHSITSYRLYSTPDLGTFSALSSIAFWQHTIQQHFQTTNSLSSPGQIHYSITGLQHIPLTY
jgi:hypothetical protein